mmetsp:Transcript_10959/g.21453  ORF Transcript_10959/g.21453 Transcript_10959/m.21453 type:complete len:340 (+) Transcript_10959:2124-3143(+)
MLKVPQADALNHSLGSPVIVEDYSILVFEGLFFSESTKSARAVQGQEVCVISSYFGILSRELFRNCVTKAVVSSAFQDSIALLDMRYLPGACGGAVYTSDFSAIVGLTLPSALEYFTPMVSMEHFYETDQREDFPVLKSIVMIRTGFSTGTGVVISPSHILTAAHVVQGKGSTVVIEHQSESYKGTVERVGECIDLALVSVAPHKLIPIEKNSEPSQGDSVFAVGFALSRELAGSKPVITRGSLNKVIEYKGQPTLLLSSALVLNGHSGGALIDSQHRLLGIISSNAKLSKKRIFPTCNLSIAFTASQRPDLWSDKSLELQELQGYETVRSLPRYRPKL